jgi:nucleotide-binding universal stress UspA family protein
MIDPQVDADYKLSLDDFHDARRRAAFDDLVQRISGKSSRMLQYDDVRKKLGGLEAANKKLMDIPLDSIVGTVGRYNDFNRKLLPLNKNDASRWARVRLAMESGLGLPPIEVYQIGEAYFILDGHHRASIAREFGATHIQAYVRTVYTRVPLSPIDQPEDVIIKAEYSDFLKKTHIDDLLPQVDLRVTTPGSYERLLDHISVHRYFMGIDEKRPITSEEAVVHWFDHVYDPIAQIIQEKNLLLDFPGRTEADLYLWILDHRVSLENSIGWQISPDKAAVDLIRKSSPTIGRFVSRKLGWVVDFLTPDSLEIQPPVGIWRQQKPSNDNQGLFNSILVAVTGGDDGWSAVRHAANVAQNERAKLIGLHIHQPNKFKNREHNSTHDKFMKLCEELKIQGTFITEEGSITRTIYMRSYWSDLLVLRLAYPPPVFSFRRFGSGLRTLIRLVRIPMLLVPPNAPSGYKKIVLAYGGGRKADEALFMAAYLAGRWGGELTVVTVKRGKNDSDRLAQRARDYLNAHHIQNVSFEQYESCPPHLAIIETSQNNSSDLVVMGGYEGGYFRELVMGSTVDRVLQKTGCSVMICH